jgi:hypothetical protein
MSDEQIQAMRKESEEWEAQKTAASAAGSSVTATNSSFITICWRCTLL